MTRAGLLPDRAHARLLAMMLAATLILAWVGWSHDTGPLLTYLGADVPPGQLSYVVSKFLGLSGLILGWTQGVLGLLAPIAPDSQARARGASWHRSLGPWVVALLLTHAITFQAAVAIRTHAVPWAYLWPSWQHGYYVTAVSVGLCSLGALLVASSAALLRTRFAAWRPWHWLAPIATAGGTAHSLMIGSESRSSPVTWAYVLLAACVLVALATRVRAIARRRTAAPTT